MERKKKVTETRYRLFLPYSVKNVFYTTYTTSDWILGFCTKMGLFEIIRLSSMIIIILILKHLCVCVTASFQP